MNKGFSLIESLLSLLIILIAVSLLTTCVMTLYKQKDMGMDEKIHKEWFYSD